jgi:hypothetical protein
MGTKEEGERADAHVFQFFLVPKFPANGSKESSSPHLQAFSPFVVVGGTWSLRAYAAAVILFRCLQCQQLLLQAVWKQGEREFVPAARCAAASAPSVASIL